MAIANQELYANNVIDVNLAPGDSPMICPQCHVPVPMDDFEVNGINDDYACAKCDAVFAGDDACVSVLDGHKALYENPALATEMRWFHISRLSPEQMEFSTDREMHLGQLDTVNDYFDNVAFFGLNGYWLYEVRLKPGTIVEDTVLCDDNYWDDVCADFVAGGSTAWAYVNRYELFGSVSLIVRRDAVELVKATENGLYWVNK